MPIEELDRRKRYNEMMLALHGQQTEGQWSLLPMMIRKGSDQLLESSNPSSPREHGAANVKKTPASISKDLIAVTRILIKVHQKKG